MSTELQNIAIVQANLALRLYPGFTKDRGPNRMEAVWMWTIIAHAMRTGGVPYNAVIPLIPPGQRSGCTVDTNAFFLIAETLSRLSTCMWGRDAMQ